MSEGRADFAWEDVCYEIQKWIRRMNVKYALLTIQLSSEFKIIPKTEFEEGVFVQTVSPETLFKNSSFEHWKEWLGSIAWEELSGATEVVVAWQAAESTSVLDKVNKNLVSVCGQVFGCLALVTPLCFSVVTPHYITGEATIVGGELEVQDILEHGTLFNFVPSYWHGKRFDGMHFDHDKTLSEWCESYGLINQLVIGAKSDQLVEAYRSLQEAFRTSWLEFKLPNLVRAVEALVVIHHGASEYKKIIPKITGVPPVNDLELEKSLKSRLKQVYELRNDCSHGKKISFSIQKKNHKANVSLEMARLECLSEWVAQRIFHKALRASSLNVFRTRDDLDQGGEWWM